MIKIKNCTGGYGKNILWKHLDLEINRGDLVAIAGANGTGKTTLLNYMSGLAAPLDGEIIFRGNKIRDLSLEELATSRSFLSQQTPDSIPFNCRNILEMGLMAGNRGHLNTSEKDQKITRICEELQISELCNKHFNCLSGGEKRKILFGRALLQSTQLIFMDEPAAFLDPGQTLFFYDKLRQLHLQNNSTMIVITHNLDMIINYFPKVVLLGKNGIIDSGDPQKVLIRSGETAFGLKIHIGTYQNQKRTWCKIARPHA
ncbi:MAG: ABC transporter ATP-binding protein [Deltaproteobacteria bacterium]|nr:ABC transporter ATP-binding protein [Deltaproteobacteria bacterium]